MDIAVVSLCSTKNLMLEGGPLPWIVDTSGYYEEGEKDLVFVLNYDRRFTLLTIQYYM